MIGAAHKQSGFLAALAHRLSGIALAVFMPIHFMALATALNGADALDRFLTITTDPLVKLSELVIVLALATHMVLGLRVLAIEFLGFRERTLAALSTCIVLVLGVSLLFLLNAG
jgi:fumarate reductase subunit D